MHSHIHDIVQIVLSCTADWEHLIHVGMIIAVPTVAVNDMKYQKQYHIYVILKCPLGFNICILDTGLLTSNNVCVALNSYSWGKDILRS